MKIVPASALLASLLAVAFAANPPAPPAAAPQRTTILAEHFEMKTVGDETRSIFDGTPDKQVTLTGTNLSIVCDHLEVIAVAVGASDATIPTMEKFKYLLATGRVRIVQGDREATCGRAEVFPRDGKIELTEKPVVIDRGNDTRGAGRKITMYRGERRVIFEGSEFDGPEIKDLGFDKNQPAPPPATGTPASAPVPASSAGVSLPSVIPPTK